MLKIFAIYFIGSWWWNLLILIIVIRLNYRRRQISFLLKLSYLQPRCSYPKSVVANRIQNILIKFLRKYFIYTDTARGRPRCKQYKQLLGHWAGEGEQRANRILFLIITENIIHKSFDSIKFNIFDSEAYELEINT